MKLVLRFALGKLEKLTFKKIFMVYRYFFLFLGGMIVKGFMNYDTFNKVETYSKNVTWNSFKIKDPYIGLLVLS